MPKISVIIVNWNGRHFLDACLSSLRNQVFSDFETILVDNGSQDGSADFVNEHFPEVQVIALNANLGFSSGNITGYDQARGSLIVLLNNDTTVQPDWLLQIYQGSKDFPSAGSFACKMLFFDEPERIENCGFELSPTGTTTDLGRGEPDGAAWAKPRALFGACGGAAVYRRQMLESIGFLDPAFFLIYEDVDLAFRAQLRGFTCIFLPSAVVYHRYRSSIVNHSSQHVFYAQRNIELLYFKSMPLMLIFRSLPQRFLYEVGSAIYFTKLGLGGPFLSAKVAALRLLPSVFRERQRVMKDRSVSNRQLLSLMSVTSLAPKWKKVWSSWASNQPGKDASNSST